MKPRILILDTYYPEAIKSMPINRAATYESNLQSILYQSFGTADFYSRNLRALGWDAQDVIINHRQLNSLRHSWPVPDVLFLQDLNINLKGWATAGLIAGQLSCPWPGDDNVRKCQILFTSFPHYVARIEALGVKAVYNPLAFDPIVLERVKERWSWLVPNVDLRKYEYERERIYDVTFVGGVGNPGHWRKGMEVLNAVADAIPTFKWWGYGADHLPINSALFQKYQGQAWGLDMYDIFCRSKIVLNRHGEVAEGYSNNMRMFEATGCGALLLTEQNKNKDDFFAVGECLSYVDTSDAIWWIKHALDDWKDGKNYFQSISTAGQQRTLRDHTYAQRMKTVSDTLMEMLCKSPATTAK